MSTMTAYRLTGWQQPPELVDIGVPVPGPGEVLVRVGGVGLCHSDILFLDAPAGVFDYPLPYTLGHEIAGWVAETGPGVDDLSSGDAVVASAHLWCGECEMCLRGYDNYCTRHHIGLGFGHDGGLADFVLVRRHSLVGPTTLRPRDAAPLADAGATSYHAVTKVLPKLVPGSTALVLGAGGLGGYAIQHLRLLSATRIVAVDLDEARCQTARELGADEALRFGPDVAERVRELTGGRGAEGVFDFVGSDETLATALHCARVLGSVAFVGAGGGTARISWSTLPRECEVFIPQGGTIADLTQVVALAETGRLQMLTEVFGLSEVETAYARLREGTLQGRAVVVPGE